MPYNLVHEKGEFLLGPHARSESAGLGSGGFITTPSALTLTASVSRRGLIAPEHLIDMAARRLLTFCVGVQKRLCRRSTLNFREQADEISRKLWSGIASDWGWSGQRSRSASVGTCYDIHFCVARVQGYGLAICFRADNSSRTG